MTPCTVLPFKLRWLYSTGWFNSVYSLIIRIYQFPQVQLKILPSGTTHPEFGDHLLFSRLGVGVESEQQMGFQIAHCHYFTFPCIPAATQAPGLLCCIVCLWHTYTFFDYIKRKTPPMSKCWGPFYFVLVTVVHGKDRSNLNGSLEQTILKEG